MDTKNQQQGFTLVEVLVAIGLFSIVVAIGMGGFVQALRTQREIAALISAQSNASVALEQMAREIRTGYLFCDLPGSTQGEPLVNVACQPSGGDSGCSISGNVWTCNNILDFYNAFGAKVDYHLDWDTNALERSQSALDGVGGYVPITGSGVKVTYLTFTLFGNAEGDHWPPRITISMGVVPNSTDPALANNVFNLQTTVSAREIDGN